MPSMELGRRLLLRLLRFGQHLQRLFDVLLKLGRSIWTTANMRGHDDIGACSGRAIRIGHDDVGREFELDSAEIDSNSRDAIEIDKWRVLGPQCSGANRWQLGGLARLGHGYLPRLCETGTSSIKYIVPLAGGVMLYPVLCYIRCYVISGGVMYYIQSSNLGVWRAYSGRFI